MLPYIVITIIAGAVCGLMGGKKAGTTTIPGLQLALYLGSGLAGAVCGLGVSTFAAIGGAGYASLSLVLVGLATGFVVAWLGRLYQR